MRSRAVNGTGRSGPETTDACTAWALWLAGWSAGLAGVRAGNGAMDWERFHEALDMIMNAWKSDGI